ncbi:hypothetical protein M8J76_010139 [Diaphorina citri]|nr:hypothetical protein M8J75_009128 [Diaphorina citri]KAI5726876.1 hypothetical protein M8J76_010139 [Diaphorina citri]KAI5732160.1 hypothetical protein M8J77_022421 [Diaphorina citri]
MTKSNEIEAELRRRIEEMTNTIQHLETSKKNLSCQLEALKNAPRPYSSTSSALQPQCNPASTSAPTQPLPNILQDEPPPPPLSTPASTSAAPQPLSEPSPIQDKPSVSAPDHSQPPDASPSLNSTTACNNLLVIGDSHCRDLTSILKTFAPPNCKVNCIAMPGKKLHQVVSAIHVNKLEPNTNICVVAGTNDIFKTPFDNLVKSYSVLHEKCKQFKIFVVLPPPRYDVRNINSHILKINCKIKHHISQYNNFTYIDPKTFLHMGTYSRDRLHLNGKGKQKLCMNIITKVHGRVTGRPSSDVMHRIHAQHESRTQHKLTKYKQARHTTRHTQSPAPSRNIPSLLHLNTNPPPVQHQPPLCPQVPHPHPALPPPLPVYYSHPPNQYVNYPPLVPTRPQYLPHPNHVFYPYPTLSYRDVLQRPMPVDPNNGNANFQFAMTNLV